MLCINKRLYRPGRSDRSGRSNRSGGSDRPGRSNGSQRSDRPGRSNGPGRNRGTGSAVCIFYARAGRKRWAGADI